MSKLKFTYKGKEGVAELSPLSGLTSVQYDGENLTTQKDGLFGRKWVGKDGAVFTLSNQYGLIPQLKHGADLIPLTNLQSWEMAFVLLPLLIVILSLGGVLPAIASIMGVYLMINLFSNPEIDRALKIAASIGYTVGVFLLVLAISILLAFALAM
jgi:hypothetical protein